MAEASEPTESEQRLMLNVHKRKYIRVRITKYCSKLAEVILAPAAEQILLIKTLRELKADLIKLDEVIQMGKMELKYPEAEMEDEVERCGAYQNQFREVLHAIEILNPEEPPTPPPPFVSSPPMSVEPARSLLKSPTAPLPRFNSEQGENLETFFHCFEQTLSKFRYTEYDKLLLLKQQVDGKGSYLLESLEPHNQTYEAAKQLLNSAFASVDMQIFNIIGQMCELKLTYDTEPFKYMSDMRKIQQAFLSLNISVSDVLRYFFFNGLNESFKSQLVLVTNNVRPTLRQILDNYFDANERYLAAQIKFKDRKKNSNNYPRVEKRSSIMALSAEPTARVSNPFVKCTMCNNDSINSNHPINKCSKYVSPSEKVTKLKSIDACIKCGCDNHSTSECKFRFKNNCRNCTGWHFSFLCINPSNNSPKSSKGKTSQSSVATTTTNCATNGSSDDLTILSTFVCESDKKVLRGVRDSGSQSNLILESVLANVKHKVLSDDVAFTVTGVTGVGTYKSKLVLVDLKLGSEIKTIKFRTMQKILVYMRLPGLVNVVNKFIDHGFTLADKFLLSGNNIETIDNLDLLLGANAEKHFYDETVRFGPNNDSVFLSTQLGVMLRGDLPQMISDLEYLPRNSNMNNHHVNNVNICLYKDNSVSSSVNTVQLQNYSDDFLTCDNLDSELISKAPDKFLESHCDLYLNREDSINDNHNSDQDNELVEYLLDNCSRKSDGRVIMPLLWNSKVHHLLANNFNIARNILHSSKKKLQRNSEHLALMDSSLRELLDIGAIEKIENLDSYREEFPSHSFLAHMPIIKINHESTKCRVVFLSNLKDKQERNSISHNQAMLSGPCLNQKLSVALINLRFGKNLLCFDLRKAFLQVELSPADQSRLLFLWFKDPVHGDFSIEGYKNVRLSFGLRCSPTILMVTLYKILIVDAVNDSLRIRDLKQQIYSLIYMDNGSIACDSTDELTWAYNQLDVIFNPYKFELQQFCTNNKFLQDKLPVSEKCSPAESELFGLIWNKDSDTLSTKKKTLNETASTKRLILKSIAENFDPYNFDGPIINRARLFLHSLQMNKNLGWDTKISHEDIKEWSNISKQVNSSKTLVIPRFVGSRSDSYDLIAFCDSSKMLYGTVIFIQSRTTKNVNFVLAKNRMITSQLESKSIPSLELMSSVLAAESLIDLLKELSGPLCLNPIDIRDLFVYSDSLVALSWIRSYFLNLTKMNKQSVFVMNRLKSLQKLTDVHPITFSFIDGISNPSDYITRPVSYKVLSKTNYLTGPKFLSCPQLEVSRADILKFTVPSHHSSSNAAVVVSESTNDIQPVLDVTRFSNINRLIGAYKKVFLFIYQLKNKIDNSFKYEDIDLDSKVLNLILKSEQKSHFADVLSYFDKINAVNSEIPNIVNQMNLFVDGSGLIRVGSKLLKNRKFKSDLHCPILLPKDSHITQLIVRQTHEKLNHAGIYTVLADLRKKYWIPHYYSCCKKILRNCIRCRRFTQRTIKLNQSPYREFRLDPSNVPFSNVFIDHIGPFYTKNSVGVKEKTYLLCITCLFTRSVNLIVSIDLTTVEFLRAFQIHVFSFGMPQKVYSDLGTQIVAGSNIIVDFLNDSDTHKFFKDNGVTTPVFDQYFKGHSELGSLVESLVKQTKLLIFGAIRNNVLLFREFEFVVAQTVSLLNKRPVAFRECLRGDIGEDLPQAITPEKLIYGHSLPSINIVPYLQPEQEEPDWKPGDDPVEKIRATFTKLRKVRASLLERYNSEFVANLIHQAVNVKDRYSPVTHKSLRVADLVLLKEQHCKPAHYPMAVVREIVTNDLGETTGAVLFKGKTRETIKRHASCIIPLLRPSNEESPEVTNPEILDTVPSSVKALPDRETRSPRIRRRAFENSNRKTRAIFKNL